MKIDVIKANEENIIALTVVSFNKKGDLRTHIYGLERYSSPRRRLHFFGSNRYDKAFEDGEFYGMSRVLKGHVVERLTERAYTIFLTGEESLSDTLTSFNRYHARIESKMSGIISIGQVEGNSLTNVSPENIKKLKSTPFLLDDVFLTGLRTDEGAGRSSPTTIQGVILGVFIMIQDRITGKKKFFPVFSNIRIF